MLGDKKLVGVCGHDWNAFELKIERCGKWISLNYKLIDWLICREKSLFPILHTKTINGKYNGFHFIHLNCWWDQPNIYMYMFVLTKTFLASVIFPSSNENLFGIYCVDRWICNNAWFYTFFPYRLKIILFEILLITKCKHFFLWDSNLNLLYYDRVID